MGLRYESGTDLKHREVEQTREEAFKRGFSGERVGRRGLLVAEMIRSRDVRIRFVGRAFLRWKIFDETEITRHRELRPDEKSAEEVRVSH